jgi:ribosome maturation factor RimP
MGLWPIFCFYELLMHGPLTGQLDVAECGVLREQLIELLEPVVRHLGYALWELEYAGRRNGGLLRLYIDSPAGIDVEACERVSRAVSEVLDESDPIPAEYTLEVSSPGLDRVLRTEAHFAQFIGERANVEVRLPVDGRRRFLGKILTVAAGELQLEVDGQMICLAVEGIHKARLAPEL